jgi:hypothetical protein
VRTIGARHLRPDRRHGVDVNALERAGDLPATRVVRTPGGTHTIFTADPQFRFPAHSHAFPGGEIKHRGYVLSPPSLHPAGGRYELMGDDDPAPIPTWLLEIVMRVEWPKNAGAVCDLRRIEGRPVSGVPPSRSATSSYAPRTSARTFLE